MGSPLHLNVRFRRFRQWQLAEFILYQYFPERADAQKILPSSDHRSDGGGNPISLNRPRYTGERCGYPAAGAITIELLNNLIGQRSVKVIGDGEFTFSGPEWPPRHCGVRFQYSHDHIDIIGLANRFRNFVFPGQNAFAKFRLVRLQHKLILQHSISLIHQSPAPVF